MFPEDGKVTDMQTVGFDSAVLTECRRLEVKDLDLYVQMPMAEFNTRFLASKLPEDQQVARISEDMELVWRCLTAIRCHLGRQQYDATLQIPKTPEDLQQFEMTKMRLLSFENLCSHVFWYMVMEKHKHSPVNWPLKMTEGFVVVACPVPQDSQGPTGPQEP
jgi:hypothetical protein